MKRLVLLVAVLLLSFPTLAGEYLMNEEVAYGLRVTFSEPVMITHFGDVLMAASPEGPATEFVFSGGELQPWVGHWLIWEPAYATLDRAIWIATPTGEWTETQVAYTFNGAQVMIPCRFGLAPLAAGINASVWQGQQPQIRQYDSWYIRNGWYFPQDCCIDLSSLDEADMRAFALDNYNYQLFIDGVQQLPTGVYIWQDGIETWPDEPGTSDDAITCALWAVSWLFEFNPGEIPPGEYERYGEFTCVLQKGTHPNGDLCYCNAPPEWFDSCTGPVCMVFGRKLLVIEP